MTRVRWSSDALDDFDASIEYIARSDPRAAVRVAERIEKSAEALEQFAMGRAGRFPGTYEKPVPRLPYIIVYRLGPEASGAEEILFLRVIHTSRNWPAGSWPED